jgi:uncharacterized membrane protein
VLAHSAISGGQRTGVLPLASFFSHCSHLAARNAVKTKRPTRRYLMPTAVTLPHSAPRYQLARYWPVLGFATLAGMRSAGAPTLLSHYLVRHPAPALATSPLRLLQQPAVALALKLAAVKEFKHDKQPSAAPRTAPRGLSLRTLGGALAGAAWCKATGQSALRGALLGGLGAAAATFGWYQLRKSITEKTGLPPTTVGLAEDVLLWSAGAVLLHYLPPPAAPATAQ